VLFRLAIESPVHMDRVFDGTYSSNIVHAEKSKHMKTRKTLITFMAVAVAVAFPAAAQEIQPVWVQHHNGLVNVDPANKLPILVKAGATGDEAYIGGGQGKIEGYANFLPYDDDHYLLGINENGINEATETDPAKLDAATKCPDRSMVWIDAHTGKWLGVAIKTEINPVPLATQSANPFWWKIAVDQGPYGQKAIYTGFKYKLLRYAPSGTVPDPNFPNGRPVWSTNVTEAWVEPVPGEPNPSRPPLDKFVPAIHYSFNDAGVDPTKPPALAAPVTPDDPNWSSYLDSSSGDGSASFRVKALRVFGSGTNTVLWAGGATWRSSTHEQEFATVDGLNFYPIARLNDRGDCWGAKGCYALGGEPSSIRTAPDGRKWCIQGHYPGTGWPARPGRYVKDPAAPDDVARDPNAMPPTDANDAGTNHKSRPHFYDPDNRELGSLPAFCWESAGTCGICGPNHAVDGVQHYDGNWVLTADTAEGADYIVSYAIPSWDQQFGQVGPNWPNSVDPNSIFKPGWVGVHTLDGKIAPGANNAWKLPCYETDEPIVDPNGNGGTGFDYGYNGDVTVYPDASAPPGSGKALVLVSFGEYGFGVFVVSNKPASGSIVSPTAVNTVANHPVVLNGQFTGTGSPLLYRWQKDDGTGHFVDVPGGQGNLAKFGQNSERFSYTIARAQISDAGRYRFLVGNPAGMLTSAVAIVSVTADTVPPVILSASSVDGTTIDITFDELLDPRDPPDGSATDSANYAIAQPGLPIGAAQATLQPDGKSVRLSGLNPPLASAPFTVTVSGLLDVGLQNQTSSQMATGVVQNFTAVDINTPDVGVSFSSAPGTYEIQAGGSDFSGTSDSGHFLYKPQSGDFDVKVQIASNVRPSNRNGIMARESEDAGAVNVHVTWNPDAGYGATVRPTTGDNTAFFSPGNTWVCDLHDPPAVWLRLQRVGDVFTAYRSSDGKQWIELGTTTVTLPETVLLGLAANRGGGTGLSRTVFANYGENRVLQLQRLPNGQLQLSWHGGGVLEAAQIITGPWSNAGVDQTNPQIITPTGAQRFYRLR
jgi:regulation of enolase protein 1 (concanavalin A-like superfamily)